VVVVGARPPPFNIPNITYKFAVYAPAERADTLPPTSTLSLYWMLSVVSSLSKVRNLWRLLDRKQELAWWRSYPRWQLAIDVSCFSVPSQGPILAWYSSVTTGLGVRPPFVPSIYVPLSLGHSFLGLFSVFPGTPRLNTVLHRFSSKILGRLP
jgi:hypothetical protein